MSDIQLIKVEQELRQEFIAAWEAAFSRQLDSKVYDWIFDDVNVIYAALVDGQIAAGYCLYPLECVLDREFSTALLCNNVFVHPEFQGRHLFTKLGKLALQDAGCKGYGQIALGIPNRQALPGHKRVGWGVQPAIKFLEKESKPSAVANTYWLNGSLTDVQRNQIELCSRKSSKNRNFSIVKTSKFVKWRYESKPGTSYYFGFEYDGETLLAYCVCKFYEPTSTLHVIDIDGFDACAVRKIISRLSDVNENYVRVNVWGSTAHAALFLESGFDFTETEDSLIFISPGYLKAINFENDINICLADNDVY